MNISTILNKFQISTISGINGLIDGSTIWKNYKQIRGNSKKTIVEFINDNNLKYVIISKSFLGGYFDSQIKITVILVINLTIFI